MKTNRTLYIIAGIMIASIISAGGFSKEPQLDYEAYMNQYFAYFNAHDLASMAAMYSEEAAFKDPSLGPGIHIQSREDIITKYTELSEMIPDVRDSLVNLYPSGNNLTVEFISMGTAPDGSKFFLPICAILTIENGLITKDYTYYDNF